MANGKIRFGKQSGGQLALVFPDGVANTEVIVPESGVLATEDYVDNNSDIGAITSYSQISGTNTIEGLELTNNIHDIFNDGSCVATYQLNESANDLGGTYNGTATNVTYQEGKFGQAGKGINSASTIIANIPYNTFSSYSLWIKPIGAINIFGNNNGSNTADDYFCLYVDSAGLLHTLSSNGVTWASTGITLDKNKFTFIYVQRDVDSNKLTIFIDGVNLGAFTSTVAKGTQPTTLLFSGEGLIGQVRIFNRTLTQAEIDLLYTEARVSANATLNINQCTFIYPKGLTPRGYAKSSDTFTGSVPTSGVSDGWKYVAKDENSNFSFYTTKPTLGKTSAELYLKDGKLYKSSDDTAITPVSFLSNKVRFASGIPVELAPSGIAKSVTETIEVKEVLGKNAILAYALIDMTATPTTILDSYNVASVTRVSNGVGKVTLEVPTDKDNVTAICSSNAGVGSVTATTKSEISFATATTNQAKTVVIVLGGKN